METETRKKLAGIVYALMLADNLGDVHDEINTICRELGFALEGDFLEGWPDEDFVRVEAVRDEPAGGDSE